MCYAINYLATFFKHTFSEKTKLISLTIPVSSEENNDKRVEKGQ